LVILYIKARDLLSLARVFTLPLPFSVAVGLYTWLACQTSFVHVTVCLPDQPCVRHGFHSILPDRSPAMVMGLAGQKIFVSTWSSRGGADLTRKKFPFHHCDGDFLRRCFPVAFMLLQLLLLFVVYSLLCANFRFRVAVEVRV
jgi:hypothetical protein